MLAISDTDRDEPAGDADDAVRQLYVRHAPALRRYVERFCPDRSSADDIVPETFIRAWRHLPQFRSGDRPARPWLFRVARNPLIDANGRPPCQPVMVRAQAAEQGPRRHGTEAVLDRTTATPPAM